MRTIEPSESTIDVARDSDDGLAREEWTFHQDGSVRAYAKAERAAADVTEWTYTLLTYPDSLAVFGDLWKDPPQDVLDEAQSMLASPAVAAPMVPHKCSACGTMARPGTIHCGAMVDPFDYPNPGRRRRDP